MCTGADLQAEMCNTQVGLLPRPGGCCWWFTPETLRAQAVLLVSALGPQGVHQDCPVPESGDPECLFPAPEPSPARAPECLW